MEEAKNDSGSDAVIKINVKTPKEKREFEISPSKSIKDVNNSKSSDNKIIYYNE